MIDIEARKLTEPQVMSGSWRELRARIERQTIEIERLKTANEYAFGELAKLRAEVERLKADQADAVARTAQKVIVEIITPLQVEIERLTKQCEGLHQSAMNNGQDLLLKEAEIERLTAAIAWTKEVRPSKNPESGGAIVHMTWDQFNTMRALAEPKP